MQPERKERQQRKGRQPRRQRQSNNIEISTKLIEQLFFTLGSIPKNTMDEVQDIQKAFPFRRLFMTFDDYFKKKQQNFQYSGKYASNTIERLCHYHVPNIIIYAYLEVMDINFAFVKPYLNKQKLLGKLDKVSIRMVPRIIEVFGLNPTDKQAYFYLKELLAEYFLKEAATLAKTTIRTKKAADVFPSIIQIMVDFVMENCSNQKSYGDDLKYVAGCVKSLGFGHLEYPQLQRELELPAMRYHLSQGWEYLQEIYEERSDLLTKGVLSLLAKNKLQEAVAICYRNDCVVKDLYGRNRRMVIDCIDDQNYGILANPLRTKKFAPSSQEMISLKDLGVRREDVIVLSHHIGEKELQRVMDKINAAQVIAIDTESVVNRTALQTDLDILALIQVAIPGKVFVFDAFNISESETVKKGFGAFFQNKQKKLIGHALQNDYGVFARLLNLPNKNRCQIIEVKDVFPESDNVGNSPSLVKLCERVFNQKLCKKFTCTNWERRPLLENQLHYAALDAYVVLEMYRRLLEQRKNDGKPVEKEPTLKLI